MTHLEKTLRHLARGRPLVEQLEASVLLVEAKRRERESGRTMTLLLVDVSHIFWSTWHASADKEIGAAFQWTIEKIAEYTAQHDHVAICCDAPPYFRRDIFPEYKAQREAQPPAAREQFKRVKDRLAKDGHVLWYHQGYEADDVIGGAVRWARALENPVDVVIASNDKDLLQLVGDGVRVLSTRTGETLTERHVEEKFGVAPEQMRDLLALMGDKSDNIPGIPGVGPKKAAALLKQFGTLAGIAGALDVIEPPKLRDLVREHLGNIELSRKLVTLRTDAPIDYEAVFRPREAQPVTDFHDAEFEDIDEPDPQEDSDVSAAPKTETPAPEPEAQQRPKTIPTNGAAMVVAPQNFEQGLQPTSLGGAHKLAKGLFESRLYSRFPNPEAIWAVIIRGREMGLGALTALDNFHLIEGKPAPHAHLLVARAKAHPDCEYFQFVGGDHTFAEYETKNRKNPKPTRLRYTYEQAERAGITKSQKGKTNWEKRPEEMLRKTCAVQLGRIEYPEAMQGLYAIEELGDE